MKKVYFLSAFSLITILGYSQQCTPDASITEPGIYPDTIENLPHAYAGAAYSSVVQINVLTDTVVPQGNVVVDNIKVDSITGMPAGFSYVCNPVSCTFPAGQTRCMTAIGSPTLGQVGTYTLIIHCTLNGRLFGFIPVSQTFQRLGYKIVILGPPAAQFSGTPTTVCSQGTVTFTDQSTNEPTTWNWSFPGGIPSSSTLQNPPPIKYNGSGNKNVTLSVTSPAGSNSLTKTAYITVNSNPSATVTPAGAVTICSGSNVLFSANTGTGLSYQWIRNSVDISGATSSTYTATTGGNYKVRVTKTTGCSKTSAATTVSISTVTATATPSGSTTFCSGGSVTISANTGTGLTYQWVKGSTDIAGATGQTYNATATGTYKVRVTNSNGCSKTSAGVAVTSNPLPAANVTASGPLSFCAGGSVTFTASAGAGYTYQWKKNGANINGATLQGYTATTAGTYRVVVTHSNGCTKQSTGKVVTIPCRLDGSRIEEEGYAVIYPNPTSSITNLDLEITQQGFVSIKMFDITGKLINTIAEGNYLEGKHQITFDAGSLNRGIYFVVINDAANSKTIKLVVNKD